MSENDSGQTRRTVLRKSGSVLAGLGSGIIGLRSASTPAAAAEVGISISGPGTGTTVSYEIHVTGDIYKKPAADPSDTDHGSWVSGEVTNYRDSYALTGLITEIYLNGPGTATISSGGNLNTSRYKVDIYTTLGDQEIFYIWDQEGNVTERNGSLESNDSIGSGNYVTGYVSTGADRFYAHGRPTYFSVDSNSQGFHWDAFDI